MGPNHSQLPKDREGTKSLTFGAMTKYIGPKWANQKRSDPFCFFFGGGGGTYDQSCLSGAHVHRHGAAGDSAQGGFGQGLQVPLRRLEASQDPPRALLGGLPATTCHELAAQSTGLGKNQGTTGRNFSK